MQPHECALWYDVNERIGYWVKSSDLLRTGPDHTGCERQVNLGRRGSCVFHVIRPSYVHSWAREGERGKLCEHLKEEEMKWQRMSLDCGFNPHQIKGGLMAVRSCRKEVLEINLKSSKWSCCSVKVEIITIVIKLSMFLNQTSHSLIPGKMFLFDRL